MSNCVPRPDRDPLTHKPKPKRPEWPIEASIFFDYITKEENTDLIKRCFEKDWSEMKKLKYKKGTEKDVKDVAKGFYKDIKEAYRV